MALARRHPVATFFLAAFVLTWAVWVPRALVQHGLLDWPWPIALGRVWSYGPALGALATVALVAGRDGLRRLGRGLTRWRIGPRWWALVLLGPFAVSWGARAAHQLLTGRAVELPPAHPAELLPFAPLLLALALTDGVGEELGWRGVALPGLRRRLAPAAAGALLGGVWAAWHLPLIWTRGAALEGRPFPALLFALVPASILFAWVYHHTGGSLPAAILLHATQNLADPSPPRADEGFVTPYVMAVALKWALALAVLAADPALLARPRRADARPMVARRSGVDEDECRVSATTNRPTSE